MVTCYDSAFARIVDASPVDVVLVGDSLGNVVLGHPDTIPVTLDDMIHHCRAVSRVVDRALVAVDMPFGTYQVSGDAAVQNAIRLIQQGGASAVKLEGGTEVCEQVRRITSAGIPVLGHLGLTPQSIHQIGGYKVQGKGDAGSHVLQSALALQAAGASAVVLELIPAQLAIEVTQALKIPTIGIGAGAGCDGQVLVLHDLLGFDSQFNPKFLKKYANLESIVSNALLQYHEDVMTRSFPASSHSY
jgi:3-methyl-2-oxobutanoate hydroxymethyltransferase